MANIFREGAKEYEQRAAQHEQAGNTQAAGISRQGARVLHEVADKCDRNRPR